MNNLIELRELYQAANIPAKHHGWYLEAGSDTWTMLDGIFYRNNEPIHKEKDVKAYIKKLK